MGIETAIIASSVIGAGASMSAAKQAGKRPPPRSYLGEMEEAISSQRRVLPSIMTAEREAMPMYRQLQEESLTGQLGSLESLYGQYRPAAARISQANLAQMSPLYQQAASMSRDAYMAGMAPGSAGLLDTMTRQAQVGLAAGRSLTPEMQTLAQQSARAAMAARGLTGNQAIGQEILNSYRLSNEREAEARKFATGVYGLGASLADRSAATYGAPMLSNVMSPNSLIGAASGMIGSQGPQFVQPESQYLAGVKGQQYNTEAQSNMAKAQAMAGMGAGFMSMAGAIGGGYLSNPNVFPS